MKKDYEKNQLIKGEPINMQIEGIEIEQIKNLVLNELKYYQENKMNEWSLYLLKNIIYKLHFNCYMNKSYLLVLVSALLLVSFAQSDL